jgi:energy-coupling factor transport system ATP-binding protein
MLAIKQLSVSYEEKTVLTEINCIFNRGEVVLVTGENGSGKTTLAKTIVGIIPKIVKAKVCGSIDYDGGNVNDFSLPQLSTMIGYVSQNTEEQISNLTVKDEVVFPLRNLLLQAEEIETRIEQVGEYFAIKPLFPQKTLLLSGGQAKLLTLATTGVMQPQVYVLDEPLVNLDIVNLNQVLKFVEHLRQHQKLVIIFSHLVAPFLNIANRLVVLKGGKVVDDLQGQIQQQQPEVAVLPPRTSDLGPVMISLKNVCCDWSSNQPVLKEINLTIHFGEKILVTGRNGSGKTTLARVISRGLRPKSGKIWGRPKIGLVLQNPALGFLGTSVKEELYGNCCLEQHQLADELAVTLNLMQYYDWSPFQLSGGEQKKLALCVALACQPELLILDEPIACLDQNTIGWLHTYLRGLNCAVLCLTHEGSIATVFERQIIIEDGVIIYDSST